MLLRLENLKKQTKLQNVVIKTPPSKGYRRMDTSEWNDISCETIRKFCALTTALDGDEDDQINCFKPEENPFVAILGDISEATPTMEVYLHAPTKMLIDEDEEGDEEIDVLL